MKKINYVGSFLLKLEEALVNNADMSIGEVLFSSFRKENMNGGHFFYATNEEIYTALEKFCKFTSEEDEVMYEEEFNKWISKK